MGSLEAIIAGTLGLLISGIAFWAALRFLRARPILDRWNTVNGTVVERGTFVPTEADLTVPFFRHSPLVRYEYQVGVKHLSVIVFIQSVWWHQHETV